jgi:CheY-like chemotaxis protein
MNEKGKRTCLCCGEEVETKLVDRYGTIEVACLYCGFVIDHYVEEQSEERGSEEKKPGSALTVMVAEDSEATRKLVEITLGETDFIGEVSTFENGRAFVKAVAERIQGGKPLDVVILDIEMPIIDGFGTARFLRSFEEKFKTKRHPILFFSNRKADENLKKRMAAFAPAYYLNKGSSKDADELMERVKVLVSRLEGMAAES